LQYAHAVLASSLNHAVREDQLPRNVAKLVPMATGRSVRFEPLTLDEARRLLAAARTHRLHALFELALRTGLRRGELLGLRWTDIDLNAGTLNIRRTLQRSPERGLVFLPPKTKASERRLALPTECVTAFKQHRERQAVERESVGRPGRSTVSSSPPASAPPSIRVTSASIPTPDARPQESHASGFMI
jgi:integrase